MGRRRMKKCATTLITELRQMAKELDEFYERKTIVTLVTSIGATLAGAVSIIVGLATGIGSVAVAAGVFALSCVTVSGGSRFAYTVFSKSRVEDAEAKLEKFKESFKTTFRSELQCEIPKASADLIDMLRSMGEDCAEKAKGGVQMAKTALPTGVTELGEKAADKVKEELSGMIKSSGGAVAVINAFILPISIVSMVDASVELYKIQKGKNSAAGDALRATADILQKLVDKRLRRKCCLNCFGR